MPSPKSEVLQGTLIHKKDIPMVSLGELRGIKVAGCITTDINESACAIAGTNNIAKINVKRFAIFCSFSGIHNRVTEIMKSTPFDRCLLINHLSTC
jgi:hypothetical protein